MTFPYLKGIVFCASLTNRGRWTAIDKAYRNPPLSTEQILHPEKYGETPDLPRKIDFTGLDLPEGWKLAHTNVLGEFQIQLLLTRHAGKQAAAGWDGDSYSILESPSGSLGLVWRSVWDDESEAIEFATAYSNCQTRRFQLDEPDGPTMPSEIRRSSKDLAYWIVRRGPEVVVLEGFSEPDSARLVESAFRLPSQEKTHSDSSKP
jgi:hypothetical protein